MKSSCALVLCCFLGFFTLAQGKSVLDLPLQRPGVVELEQLKKLEILQFSKALLQDDPLHCTFFSCQVILIAGKGDPLEFTLMGPQLDKNKAWAYLLSKMSPGSKIFFEEIKGVGDDGIMRHFGAVALSVQ